MRYDIICNYLSAANQNDVVSIGPIPSNSGKLQLEAEYRRSPITTTTTATTTTTTAVPASLVQRSSPNRRGSATLPISPPGRIPRPESRRPPCRPSTPSSIPSRRSASCSATPARPALLRGAFAGHALALASLVGDFQEMPAC